MIERSKTLQQLIPLGLTLVILVTLILVLYIFIYILNQLPFGQPVVLIPRLVDIAVGLTIYLKTSIDFAILMGRLMSTNPGWKNRIAIEIGTAVGNAGGTLVVIAIWVIFKNVDLLLAAMVFLASLVLFELAQGGLEHIADWVKKGGVKKYIYQSLDKVLGLVLLLAGPLLRRIMPDLREKLRGKSNLTWKELFRFSTSVPFILGLDDFAGYVPLFSIINVYGFAIGVFVGHTMLNIALFLSPSRTITAVKNEYVSLFGTLAFIGLAIYGFVEVARIIIHLF